MLRTMECSGPWNAQGRGMVRVEGCSGLRGTEGCGMLRTVACSRPWHVQVPGMCPQQILLFPLGMH